MGSGASSSIRNRRGSEQTEEVWKHGAKEVVARLLNEIDYTTDPLISCNMCQIYVVYMRKYN